MDTGGRIREIRLAEKLSQEQLAELSSLNRVTIAKYETGRVEPGASALSRIADALGVSVDALLGRSEMEEIPRRKPRTSEAEIISECVDKMPQADREKALNVFRAVYSEYFENSEGEMA